MTDETRMMRRINAQQSSQPTQEIFKENHDRKIHVRSYEKAKDMTSLIKLFNEKSETLFPQRHQRHQNNPARMAENNRTDGQHYADAIAVLPGSDTFAAGDPLLVVPQQNPPHEPRNLHHQQDSTEETSWIIPKRVERVNVVVNRIVEQRVVAIRTYRSTQL